MNLTLFTGVPSGKRRLARGDLVAGRDEVGRKDPMIKQPSRARHCQEACPTKMKASTSTEGREKRNTGIGHRTPQLLGRNKRCIVFLSRLGL